LSSKSFNIDLKPFEDRILLALKNEATNQEKFKKKGN
jgi:hypothetical protein